MKALLWKEYREKRLWVLMLTASAVLIIARGIGYTFISTGGLLDFTGGNWSDQCMIPMLVALFFGAGAFSSEIDKSAQFLFSQPVSWKKLVAAKLIVGIGVIAASAVLTAVIYRLVCPEQYARFATPEHLGLGVVWAVVVTGIPYLIGALFSTVLPGGAGVIVGVVVYGLMIAHFALYQSLLRESRVVPFSFLGWLIAPVAAMLVTARYGLTLQTADRIRRYAITVLGVLALSVLLCLVRLNPERTIPRSWFAGPVWPYTSIGPDGNSMVTR